MAVVVKTNGLDARADCARLAAVFMNDDFRLVSRAVEVRVDEIDFRLHRRQVLLCPPCRMKRDPSLARFGIPAT